MRLKPYMVLVKTAGILLSFVMLPTDPLRAQSTFPPSVMACLSKVKPAWTNGAGNAIAVQSGRYPAETEDQKTMRKDYVRYQQDYSKCLAPGMTATLQPGTYGIYKVLKDFSDQRPQLTNKQAQGVALTLSYPKFGPYSAFVGQGIAYYYSDSDQRLAELKAKTEQALQRMLLDEAAKPNGRKPSEVLANLRAGIESGKALGLPTPSVEAQEIAESVVRNLDSKYPDDAALERLRDRRGKPPSSNVLRKDLQQRGGTVAQKRKEEKARQAELLKKQTEMNDAFAKRGELLSSQALWNLERQTTPGLDDSTRSQLYTEYTRADQASRVSDPKFSGLRGLTTEQAAALAGRADLRLKAREFSDTATLYAKSFNSTLTAAYAFDVGGPDLKRGLAAGALLADSAAQTAMLIASSAGVPTPFQVFMFIGQAGNLVGGLNGIFRGGSGQDAFMEQFAIFQEALFGALRNLSSQVATGFALQGERFDRLERRLDVILAITAAEMYGRISSCSAFMRDYRGKLDLGPDNLKAELIRAGGYTQLDRCYQALASNVAADATPPAQFTTEVQLGLGVAKEGLSDHAQALRAEGEFFVDHVYPELRYLLATLTAERAKQYEGKPEALMGPYDLLTLPAATTVQLERKLSTKGKAENMRSDLGSLYSALGFPGRDDWRLDSYIRIHVEPRSTLSVLGALNATVHLLPVTNDSFVPLTEAMLSQSAMNDSRQRRRGLGHGYLIDHLPLAAAVLAQELLISGDPIAPYVDTHLGKGDCDTETDLRAENLDTVTVERRRKKNASCVAVREASVLAQNVAMLRLKHAAAKTEQASWALAYGYALGESDPWALKYVFGDMPFMRLKNDSGPDAATAPYLWHLRLAGHCESSSATSDIGRICEAGKSCRNPRGSVETAANGDQIHHDMQSRLQDRLNVCVAVRLPNQQEFEAGTVWTTSSVPEAENIYRGLYNKALLPTLLDSVPEGLQAAVEMYYTQP